jgi:hypothetical protein
VDFSAAQQAAAHLFAVPATTAPQYLEFGAGWATRPGAKDEATHVVTGIMMGFEISGFLQAPENC